MNSDSHSDLSRIYRAGATEEPPAWLDERVRAATRAQAPAGGGVLRRLLGHWQVPFACAAVVILSVSLVLVMRTEAPDMPDVPQPPHEGAARQVRPSAVARHDDAEKTAAASSAPGVKADRASDARPRVEAQGKLLEAERMQATADEQRARQAATTEHALAKANALARPAEPDAAAEVSPSSARIAERGSGEIAPLPPRQPALAAPAPAAPPAATPAPATPEARAGALDASRQESATASPATEKPAPAKTGPSFEDDPRRWLEHIEQLRREGREQEANENLERFRKRYPAYSIPRRTQ